MERRSVQDQEEQATAGRPELVPRLAGQGYGPEQVAERRAWVESATGASLEHVGSYSISSEAMRGNVENPVGACQVPLGVAGPLEIRGEHARGRFYVPLATTEGALVRSYERGMVAITRAGGASARISLDRNRICPIVCFPDVESAHRAAAELAAHLDELRAVAEATTRHGRLVEIECRPAGRDLIVTLSFTTGDAQGMNMISAAGDAICRWIVEHTAAERFLIFSGAESEKRPSGSLLAGGKGKRVVAGVRLPRRTVGAVLGSTPERIVDLWQHTVAGHLQAGALGYNGHFANGLTALFIACGQDVANVANAAVGITRFERTDLDGTGDGDLYASVTLPALTVATVGGGTGLGTAPECLAMLGCVGSGKAQKLAEIVAATLLAGELSMASAIAEGELVAAHESLGRNRPADGPAEGDRRDDPASGGADG